MKIEIDENYTAQRLDYFLQKTLNLSRKEIQKNIENNLVFVNNVPKKASYRLKMGDCIEFEEINLLKNENMEITPQNIPLHIIFEDDELLIVNKPKNMLTHPTSLTSSDTLVNALLHHCGKNLSDVGGKIRPGIVHRLDKNTAGLLMVAKTNEAHKNLAEQIKNKNAIRKYLAVALGNFEEDFGTINKPIARNLGDSVKMYVPKNLIDGATAITHFKVLERFLGATLLELQLETGRTHQIRVHLSSENHPVFGDTLYNSGSFQKFAKIKTNEQVLQSYFLAFTHPKTGDKMEFKLEEEYFDEDLIRVLKILRKDFK